MTRDSSELILVTMAKLVTSRLGILLCVEAWEGPACVQIAFKGGEGGGQCVVQITLRKGGPSGLCRSLLKEGEGGCECVVQIALRKGLAG